MVRVSGEDTTVFNLSDNQCLWWSVLGNGSRHLTLLLLETAQLPFKHVVVSHIHIQKTLHFFNALLGRVLLLLLKLNELLRGVH